MMVQEWRKLGDTWRPHTPTSHQATILNHLIGGMMMKNGFLGTLVTLGSNNLGCIFPIQPWTMDAPPQIHATWSLTFLGDTQQPYAHNKAMSALMLVYIWLIYISPTMRLGKSADPNRLPIVSKDTTRRLQSQLPPFTTRKPYRNTIRLH